MPSITSTGVGSGLDINTIVSSLMTVEKRPLVVLQERAAQIQTRLSAFGTLKGQIASLGDVASRLANLASWNPLRVDSADSAMVTATAGATAAAGKHTLEVERLAQSQVLASSPFTAGTTVVGTGTLTLEVGTTDAGVFTRKEGTSAVPITIGAANQTLAGIRDAINAAKAGVTASIVTGATGASLVLRGPEGAAGSMRVTVADADGGHTDAAGLSSLAWNPAAAEGAGRNLRQTQGAQDAKFKLDGMDLTSATNTPAGVLEGVTLTLKQQTTRPVDLTISVETMAVRKNINDFVNAYNALNKLVQSQTQVDPSGKNRGPLQADSTAVGLLHSLRGMLQGTVSGLAAPASLNAAGIELQRDGSLQVVDSRLAPLLEQPGRLAQLFGAGTSSAAASERGFGLRFKEWATQLTHDSGTLASRLDGLKRNSQLNQKQQDVQQARLDRTEARLRAQYQRLDSEMTRLNAQLRQMSSSLGLG